ncbi:MAG: ABC transporter permease subunit [Firmicutes bacterium]|nr:ABC transporter permease subunit [Bacillota bacterium]
MKTYKKRISILLWISAVLIIWEAAAYILKDVFNDPLASKKVPGLLEIAVSFSENSSNLFRQAGITMSYAAAGFAIGASVGIILALIMSLSGLCEKMILPYLLVSQMIPILGLAPIIFGLFKSIAVSRVIIAAYITFFPVSVNLLSGFKSADEHLKAMMYAYASGRYQLYTKLLIPYSLPYLFTGLKISAPMAVTAAILVDTLSGKDGIGYVIVFTLYGGGTTGQFWPAIIIAALLGLLSFAVISAAEYLLVPWKRNAVEVKI